MNGRDAPANDPWGATGLEWEIPSPPPTENFARDADRDRTARISTRPSQEVGIV